MNNFEQGMQRNDANFVPLTPLSFLDRIKDVYPDYEALIYQDSARTLINNLTNKISGYQIKETFNQSPILHQMLMEEIEIIFNSTESSSGLIEIEDSYNVAGNIFKFCTECGFNNQKLFNFCPSCGNKLTK